MKFPSRRTLLRLCGRTGLARLLAAQPSRPNVVVILADDIGYGDFGCYGATRVRTRVQHNVAPDNQEIVGQMTAVLEKNSLSRTEPGVGDQKMGTTSACSACRHAPRRRVNCNGHRLMHK